MFRISDQAILRHYRNRGIMPFEIGTDLTPQEYEGIKDKLPPEMMVRPVYVRIYPNGKIAGQIVGYTGKTGRNPDGIVDNHETIWPRRNGGTRRAGTDVQRDADREERRIKLTFEEERSNTLNEYAKNCCRLRTTRSRRTTTTTPRPG